jgi:hypothetical protein
MLAQRNNNGHPGTTAANREGQLPACWPQKPTVDLFENIRIFTLQ